MSTHPVREIAQLFGAFILVVAVEVALAQDGPSRPAGSAVASRLTAPNQRHNLQRTNT